MGRRFDYGGKNKMDGVFGSELFQRFLEQFLHFDCKEDYILISFEEKKNHAHPVDRLQK